MTALELEVSSLYGKRIFKRRSKENNPVVL